jgi:hypothetical protein
VDDEGKIMVEDDLPTAQVQFESVSETLVELVTSSPLPEFLLVCIKLATAIAKSPQNVTLVITGDFVKSTKDRLRDTEAARSFNLLRGEGLVAGKTIHDGDGSSVLLRADIFEKALDYETNPDAAFLFLRTLVHEMNHVSIYQRGESSRSNENDSWKTLNLTSAAAAIIDEYRAELGSLRRLSTDESNWNPSEIVAWLEDALIKVVTSYQVHRDVNRLVFEVGSQVLIALKQMAYCVAYETVASAELPLDTRGLRYMNTRENLSAWLSEFRTLLNSLPSGEYALSRESEQEARLKMAALLDEQLRILGFDWDEPMFHIRSDLLALI